MITSLGEERVVYVLLVYLFARVNFCPLSLPLGVRDSLRLVILAILSFLQVHSIMFSIILACSVIVILTRTLICLI